MTIPMTEQLTSELTKMKDRTGYVLEHLGPLYKTSPMNLSKAFNKLFEKCGIKDTEAGVASFHSLRHTFASMLADAGATLQIQATLTAHTLPGVVGTYTHPDVKVLRKWISKAVKAL